MEPETKRERIEDTVFSNYRMKCGVMFSHF